MRSLSSRITGSKSKRETSSESGISSATSRALLARNIRHDRQRNAETKELQWTNLLHVRGSGFADKMKRAFFNGDDTIADRTIPNKHDIALAIRRDARQKCISRQTTKEPYSTIR